MSRLVCTVVFFLEWLELGLSMLFRPSSIATLGSKLGYLLVFRDSSNSPAENGLITYQCAVVVVEDEYALAIPFLCQQSLQA